MKFWSDRWFIYWQICLICFQVLFQHWSSLPYKYLPTWGFPKASAFSYALLLYLLVLLQKYASSYPLIALLTPIYPSECSSAAIYSRKPALIQSVLNVPLFVLLCHSVFAFIKAVLYTAYCTCLLWPILHALYPVLQTEHLKDRDLVWFFLDLYGIAQVLANFFYKKLCSKYFRVCRPDSLSVVTPQHCCCNIKAVMNNT